MRTTMTARYDQAIEAAVNNHLPSVDWRLYKAQLWQESRLKPDAVSPAGARGIAQFMPGTWADMQDRYDDLRGSQPEDAAPAIKAGARYMAELLHQWRWPRPDHDRYSLALASYNAGLGNILKAQSRSGNAVHYPPIMAHLHKVTGHHASETRHYTPVIYAWWLHQLHGTTADL